MEIWLNDIQRSIVEQLLGRPLLDGYVYIEPEDTLYQQLVMIERTSEDYELVCEIVEILRAVDANTDEVY